MEMSNDFDKKKEYEAQIRNLVKELKQACNKAQIPMFFAACVSNDHADSEYELELLSPKICDKTLTKDWFCRFVDVTLGFDTVVPSPETEFDADDLF